MPRQSDLATNTHAFRVCRDVCRRTGGDFYLSTFFLPRRSRDAVHALFSFCHLMADSIRTIETLPAQGSAVGACCSTGSLDGRIFLLRQRIDHLFTAPAAVPYDIDCGTDRAVVHAFACTIQRYPILPEYLHDLIEWLRIEAAIPRFATWKSVNRFLALRWGSMGLAVAAILGLTSTGARQHVIDLGKAVGLAKILRDFPRCVLTTGRMPVPLEDLARSGYSERELLNGVHNERFAHLMRLEADRARQLFASGRLAIPWLAGDGSRLMAATVATLYDGSLDRLTRPLSTWQRVRLLPTIWATARTART